MDTSPNSNPDQPEPTDPEAWVREAIARQEERLARSRSCSGVVGQSHTFATFGVSSPGGTIPLAGTFSACINCGVTETDADYQTRLAALTERQPDAPDTPTT